MKPLRFDWDDAKAASNRKKHGVAFEEAKAAFYDANARIIADLEHSHGEERFILLGLSEPPSRAGGLSLLPRQRRNYPHHFCPQSESI